MTQTIKNKFGYFLLFLLLQSCGDSALYDRSFSFDKHEWPQGNFPKFVVPIVDTNANFDVDFTLRTTTDYPFSNIWMNISIIFPDGTKLRRPYELKITDQKGWLGQKSGTIVENTLSFPKSKLPQKGNYTFVLEQATPETVVSEVLDIGLRVSKSNQ
ncbi:MAG: gliding motility lipoprotein GldH [Bacteroidetes bacterium]|nr:gliding motility lipoprotein GldH [Bacteroidota bacterium]